MLNKILKLTVISAVLITSGFTQQQATISGYVTNNDTFEIGNAVTVAIADGSVIHNYGNIKGSGEIDGTAEATIINYNHIVEATENDPTCFRPTGGGSIADSINKTNVTVTDQKADITVSFGESNKVGNTILLTTDNCDTTDADKVLNLTNTDENPVDVLADIANELNGEGVSHSLRVVGNVRLMGDQSGFSETGTEWTTSEASIEIANPNGFPQVPVKVNDESRIDINASGVNITQDVIVTGSQFNVRQGAKFRLGAGATMWFKGPIYILPANILSAENVDWDDDTTWLVLKRNAGNARMARASTSSDLFCLRKDATRIEIRELNVTDTYNTVEIPELSNVTVGSGAILKGSPTTGYYQGSGESEILNEIADILKAGGRWMTLNEYNALNTSLNIVDRNVVKYKGNAADITDVVIPYGVTALSKTATASNEGAFYNCSNLRTVTLPNTVTKIGAGTFCNCSNLRTVTLPNSVTKIEFYAFRECTAMSSINIPSSVRYIGAGAFRATAITSMEWPSSVTTIPCEVFLECQRLTSITIPNTVTSIVTGAFACCYSLSNIIIPASVTSIGNGVFSDCYSSTNNTGLKTVTFLGTVNTLGFNVLSYCNLLESITLPKAWANNIGDGTDTAIRRKFDISIGLPTINRS